MSKPTSAPVPHVMNVQVAPGSAAEQYYTPWRTDAAHDKSLAGGFAPAPQADLIFHGGKTVPQMQFQNLYLGGTSSWRETDVKSIDQAILAAMQDKQLNNVMAQYFRGKTITCDALPSQFLPTPKPRVVSDGDVRKLIPSLFAQGVLRSTDLASTIFNFLLPSETLLNSDEKPTGNLEKSSQADAGVQQTASSLQGLGGFHHSVHFTANGQNITVYYSLDVFSEFLPNRRPNGIPVFDQPWKNVVATLYHELNEFRTDPDVGDANRTGNGALLGWTSAKGQEVGDFPVAVANPLTQVFQEVKLSRSSVTVPIQFQYSNAVHGPEGPIKKAH